MCNSLVESWLWIGKYEISFHARINDFTGVKKQWGRAGLRLRKHRLHLGQGVGDGFGGGGLEDGLGRVVFDQFGG